MKMPSKDDPMPVLAHEWKEFTLYEVNVSYSPTNPMHKAFLFVGFVRGGVPSAYTTVYNSVYESPNNFGEIYRVEVIRELASTR